LNAITIDIPKTFVLGCVSPVNSTLTIDLLVSSKVQLQLSLRSITGPGSQGGQGAFKVVMPRFFNQNMRANKQFAYLNLSCV